MTIEFIRNYSRPIFPRPESRPLCEKLALPLDPLSQKKAMLKAFCREMERLVFPRDFLLKAFALIHGDAFISNTRYEGGNVQELGTYWQSCLERWIRGEGPCQPHLSIQTMREIVQDLEAFSSLSSLMSRPDVSPDKVRCFIKTHLEIHGKCMVPLRTRGAEGRPGHVFSCMLEKSEDGFLYAVILNAGAGSEIHPLASIDTHYRRSFFFPPIQITQTNFFEEPSEIVNRFIGLLLGYFSKSPRFDYNPREIYLLFLSIGSCVSDLSCRRKAALSQRSGTCPDKTLKLLQRNFFLRQGRGDVSDYKKLIFFLKFQSMYDVFSFLQASLQADEKPNLDTEDCALIKKACAQWSRSVQKSYEASLLDEDTYREAQALISLTYDSLPVSSAVFSAAQLDGDFFTLELAKPSRINDPEATVDEYFEEIFLELSKLQSTALAATPEKCLAYIQILYESSKKLQKKFERSCGGYFDLSEIDRRRFCSIFYEAVTRLPFPAKAEDYWDRIPEGHRENLIDCLSSFAMNALTLFSHKRNSAGYSKKGHFYKAHAFLLQAMTFAITDKVARLNPAMKMEGVSYPYNFEKLRSLYYFSDRKDQERLEHVISYFSSAPDDLIIFDLPNKGSCSLLYRSGAKKGLETHLTYLDRLVDVPLSENDYLDLLTNGGNRRRGEFSIPYAYRAILGCYGRMETFLPKRQEYTPSHLTHQPSFGGYVIQRRGIAGSDFTKKRDKAGKEVILDRKTMGVSKSLRAALDKGGLQAENDVVLSNPKTLFSGMNVSEAQAARLQKMLSSPSQRFFQVMLFSREYFYSLNESSVQYILEWAILGNSHFSSAIEREPLFLDTCVNFFSEMFQLSYQEKNIEVLLFWVQIAAFAGTHAPEGKRKVFYEQITSPAFSVLEEYKTEAKRFSSDSKQRKDFQAYAGLLFFSESLLAALALQSLEEKEKAGREDWISSLLNGYILYNSHLRSLDNVKNSRLYNNNPLLEPLLHKDSVLTAYIEKKGCEAFFPSLRFLGIDTRLSVDEKNTPTSFRNSRQQSITINFPRILLDNTPLEVGEAPTDLLARAREMCGKYFSSSSGPAPSFVILGKDHIRAADGSFEVSKRWFRKSFNFFNKKSAFYTLVERWHHGQPFKGFIEIWEKEKTFWLVKAGKDQPFAKMQKLKNKESRIQAVDEQGKELPLFWINPITSEIHRVTADIGNRFSEATIFWGDEQGKIKRIEDIKSGLSFASAENRLVYANDPEYYMGDDIERFSLFSGGIPLLHDGDKEKRAFVLVPHVFSTTGFSTQPSTEESTLPFPPKTHFFYTYNQKTGLWQAPSQSAYIYLLYALKCHGEYEQTNEYVENFRPTSFFTHLELELLELFMGGNHEASGLSLSIKLYLKVLEAERTFTVKHEDLFCEKSAKSLDRLHLRAKENCIKLQKIMGNDFSLNRLHFSPTCYEVKNIVSKAFDLPYSPFSLQEAVKDFKKYVLTHRDSSCSKAPPWYSFLVSLGSWGPWKDSFRKEEISYDFPSKSFEEILKHDYKKFYDSLLSAKEEGLEAFKLNFAVLFERCREPETSLKNPSYFNLLFLYCIWLAPQKYKEKLKSGEISSSAFQEFLQEIEGEIDTISTAPLFPPVEIEKPKRKGGKIDKKERLLPSLVPEEAGWESLKEAFFAPLEGVLEKHFDSVEIPVNGFSQPFLLKKPQDCSLLAETRFEELSQAFLQLPKTYIEYRLSGDPAALKKELEGRLAAEKRGVRELETLLQKMLDWPSQEELQNLPPKEQQRVYELRQSYITGERERPNLRKHLLPSLCWQDPGILHEVNPFLSDKNILPELYSLGILFMLQASKVDQMQEALDFVESREMHSAGEVLAKQRLYNPYKNPEFLLYEYATGRMLRNRPNQVKILEEIIAVIFAPGSLEGKEDLVRRLFVEFQAGGGKTQVLAVIIAAMAYKQGKSVVFFGLVSQLDVVKIDLGAALYQVYKQGVLPFHIRLQDQVTLSWIDEMNDKLSDKPVCIVMSPESWHSLHLQWQLSLETKYHKLSGSLAKFFTLLKEKALFLIDESHINVSSMSEAVIASGEMIDYPVFARELVSEVQDLIFGTGPCRLTLEDGTFVDEALGLLHYSPSLVSEDPKRQHAVLYAIARHLAKHAFLGSGKNEEDLALYLTTKEKVAPEFLQEIRKHSPILGEKIDLAKGLLCFVLPFAFSKKLLIDYGPSPLSSVLDPKILGESTGQKYEDVDIAAVMSGIGWRQLGLNAQAMERYLDEKLEEYEKSGNDKFYDQQFLALGAPHSLKYLEDIDYKDPCVLAKFCQAIGKKKEVIEYFEKNCVFSEIKVFSKKFRSTGQELSAGSWAAIHMSATVGTAEENPAVEISNFHTSDTFLAEVIQKSLLPHNSQCLWPEERSLLGMLKALLREIDLSHVRGVLDVGGLYEKESSGAWEQEFFLFNTQNNLDFSAVLTAKIINGEKVFCISQEGLPDVFVRGSNVAEALKTSGLEGKKVFYFFPAVMTTGTDLILPSDAQMVVTGAEKTTLSSYVQGIMRMRRFLLNLPEDQRGQRIVWVGENKFAPILQEKMGEASPSAIYSWSLLQEDKKAQQGIIARAFQDIEMIIRSIVQPLLFQNREKYPDYKPLYEIPVGYDPTEKYGKTTSPRKTGSLLWEYAEDLAQKAGLNLEDYPGEKGRIQKNIDQVQQKIAEIESASQANSIGAGACRQQQVQQKQQQKQEQQQEIEQEQQQQFFVRRFACEEEDYAERELAIHSISSSPAEWKANRRFDTALFSSELILMDNFFHVAEGASVLKPIDFFMLWHSKNQEGDVIASECRVISSRDAEWYANQLQNRQRESSDLRSAVIFTAGGDVYQTDCAQAASTIDLVRGIKESVFFQEILAEIGLINGKRNFLDLQKQKVNQDPQGWAALLENIWSRLAKKDEIEIRIFKKSLLPVWPSIEAERNRSENSTVVAEEEVLAIESSVNEVEEAVLTEERSPVSENATVVAEQKELVIENSVNEVEEAVLTEERSPVSENSMDLLDKQKLSWLSSDKGIRKISDAIPAKPMAKNPREETSITSEDSSDREPAGSILETAEKKDKPYRSYKERWKSHFKRWKPWQITGGVILSVVTLGIFTMSFVLGVTVYEGIHGLYLKRKSKKGDAADV